MEQSLRESSFFMYLVLGMRKKCHGLDSLEADTGTEIGVQDVFRDQKTDVEVLTSSTCEH